MNNWLILFLLFLGSYLIGCFNNAIFISKLKKSDVRKVGSGNPGTLNMSRNFGLKIGLLTLFLDMLKGVIPCVVGFIVLKNVPIKTLFNLSLGEFKMYDLGMYACGFFAVIGHIFPVFFKFKGGKGVATTIGVFLSTSLCISISTAEWAWTAVALMSMIGAGLFIYFTEFGAAGSFIAITPPAIASSLRLFLLYGFSGANLMFYICANMFIFGICFFTWFAHRKNIERMLAGEEHPTSVKEMIVKMKAKKQEKLKDNDKN